jgi:hypothetical protein
MFARLFSTRKRIKKNIYILFKLILTLAPVAITIDKFDLFLFEIII